MTLEQLYHAIRAACNVCGDNELWVFGSQSILGTYQNPPADLVASIEVDVQPVNHPHKANLIDGALGEMSAFHQTNNYYVEGVLMEGLVMLPDGWQLRTVRLQDSNASRPSIGYCLEVHDLAVSKVLAFRPKDRDFVRSLFVHELADIDIVLKRLESTNASQELKLHVSDWLRALREEL